MMPFRTTITAAVVAAQKLESAGLNEGVPGLSPVAMTQDVIKAVMQARYSGKEWADCLAIAKQVGYAGGMDKFQSELRAACGGKLPGPSRTLKPAEPVTGVCSDASKISKKEKDAKSEGATHAPNDRYAAKPPVSDGASTHLATADSPAALNAQEKSVCDEPMSVAETETLNSATPAVAEAEQDQNSTLGGILPEVEPDARITTIIASVIERSHSLAQIMPMMSVPELTAMAEDIKAKGLLAPIVMLAGLILDGRNRLVACILAGVEPRYAEFESLGVIVPPVEWIISQNVHRRHLTVGQRSMIGAQLIPMFEKEAKCRQGARTDLQPELETDFGRSAERAAAAVGVSADSVKAALKILKAGTPEVQAAVKIGRITLNSGMRLAELPADEQLRAYTGDAKTTITALRNTKQPPDGHENVIADHPELASMLRAMIENDSAIGKEALEKAAADLVAAKQRSLAENKNSGKPGSRMPTKDQDYDKAVEEVAPLLPSACRKVKTELVDGRLTLRFPFVRSVEHIANALRDVESDLKDCIDEQLAAGEPLVIEVLGLKEGA
jgi:hypothetical protein